MKCFVKLNAKYAAMPACFYLVTPMKKWHNLIWPVTNKDQIMFALHVYIDTSHIQTMWMQYNLFSQKTRKTEGKFF